MKRETFRLLQRCAVRSVLHLVCEVQIMFTSSQYIQNADVRVSTLLYGLVVGVLLCNAIM